MAAIAVRVILTHLLLILVLMAFRYLSEFSHRSVVVLSCVAVVFTLACFYLLSLASFYSFIAKIQFTDPAGIP